MFKSHYQYSHKNALDCTIYVLKSYRLPDGRYKLKVRWFNTRGMDLGIQETITIKQGQAKDWSEFEGFDLEDYS